MFNVSINKTVIGIFPWLATFAIIFLLLEDFNYIKTSIHNSIPGLEKNTIYLLNKHANVCPGDMVKYKSDRNGSRYYRQVIASPGQVLQLHEKEYSINGKRFPTSFDWLDEARNKMGDLNEVTIPEHHFLIINSRFKTKYKSTRWPYELIKRSAIQFRATHILFAKDFSRIGEPLGSVGGCQDHKTITSASQIN